MKYSFLLPAYKSKFLEQTIDSILSQTFVDFKLLISDDCSPDDIYGVVSPYLSDSRVTYRRNETNLGGRDLVAHWNLLVDLCDTDYFVLASDDDLYSPAFLEEINKLVLRYPDVNMYYARTNIIDSSNRLLHEDFEYPELMQFEPFIETFMYPNAILCMSNCVFKRIGFIQRGRFVNFPLAWKSDSATKIRESFCGVAITKTQLFSFRVSGINISCQSGKSQSIDEKKFNATYLFGQWLKSFLLDTLKYKNITNKLAPVYLRLDGEIRTYFWAVSLKNMLHTFSSMRKNGWFTKTRTRVSFIISWLKSRI